MKAILATLSGIALIAFTYLCITLALTVRTTGEHVDETLMALSDSTGELNITLAKLSQKNGTIDQLNAAIRDVRLTVAHSDRLMTQQQKSLTTWNQQITGTLGNINTDVLSMTDDESAITKQTVTTLKATTDTIQDLQPLVSSLNSEAMQLQTTTAALNTMLPEIKETVTNVQGMTADGHETTTMTKDWLHGILHPTWATRVKNAFLDVLQHLPVP
jgi:uncharacterized phage infection (PIP) family protein YhgE